MSINFEQRAMKLMPERMQEQEVYNLRKGKKMNTQKWFATAVFAGVASVAVSGSSLAGSLNIIMEQVPDYDIVKALTEKFVAENPDIEVTFDAMPFDAMRDKILTSALAGSATYNVIIVDNPWMEEFAGAGFLAPLDEFIQADSGYDFDDFVGPLRDIDVVGDATYGVPYYNYALGLIVRQDIFDDQGIAIPTTLEDYVDVVKSLTKDGFSGAAMQPQKGYKVMEEWKNWLYATGGELFDSNGDVAINSPEAVKALEMYIDTFNTSAPKGSVNWGFDEALRAVASGRAATMLSYNWMLPALNAKGGMSGDLAGKFTLNEVPGGKAVLGSWSWAIPANVEDKDEAWKYISWITSKAVAKDRVIAGGAPVRTSIISDPDVWEKGFGEDYYKTLLGILEDAAPLSSGTSAEELIDIVGTELSAAVSGQKTVQEALDDAAKGVERAR